MDQLSFLNSEVERIDYKGYEQRVWYDLERECWKVLAAIPEYKSQWVFHTWYYAPTRTEALAEAYAEVDAWLAAADATERTDFEARWNAGLVNLGEWIDRRWGRSQSPTKKGTNQNEND